MKRTAALFILIAIVATLSSCSKKNSVSTTVPTVADTSLKQLPFPFGFAVNVSKLRNNTAYKNVLVAQAKSITAETAMKIAYLHPAQNTYVYTDADYLVDFALQNNIRVHGHTLVWHQSLPSWITNFVGDSTAWENLLKTHIQTIVTHFKGKVASWDVVNEAIENDGNGYRASSIWYQKLGIGFIARSFQYAHEADPNALLFYNDYGNEWGVVKRNTILNLINDLKNKGVPINGIGMQMHTSFTQLDANIQDAISVAVTTGLKIHISELDVSMNANNNQTLTFNSTIAQQQADKYKMIVKAFNIVPKAQQFGITTWGIGDVDSWIPGFYARPDWPLLFDNTYQKKDAFFGVLAGVK